MFGRRAVQVPSVPEVDPLLEVSLASVPDRALWGEVRRRGFVCLPSGAWEGMCAEYEAQLAAVKAHAPTPAEWMAAHNLVDGTEVVKELGEYAGRHFPAAVAEICELSGEIGELRTRADRAETEASLLASAVITEELPETRYLTDDNEDHSR